MTKIVRYEFRLYIAGGESNSDQALANLTALCRAHLPGRHEIEIVDVLLQPKRALRDGIFMTPTLIQQAPAPGRTFVGTLSQTEPVLKALGIPAAA